MAGLSDWTGRSDPGFAMKSGGGVSTPPSGGFSNWMPKASRSYGLAKGLNQKSLASAIQRRMARGNKTTMPASVNPSQMTNW